MNALKEHRVEVRFDKEYMEMLNYLTLKYKTTRSNLIRTLILEKYEETKQKESNW